MNNLGLSQLTEGTFVEDGPLAITQTDLIVDVRAPCKASNLIRNT